MFQFQAGMIGSFKKLRGDVMLCGDDCGALAQLIRSLLDHAHFMLTQVENQNALLNMSAAMSGGPSGDSGSLKLLTQNNKSQP
jgi:hypothetical protein